MTVLEALNYGVPVFTGCTTFRPGPTYVYRTPARPKARTITFPKITCAPFTREDFEAKHGEPPDLERPCGDFPFTEKECDMLRVFLTEENAKP